MASADGIFRLRFAGLLALLLAATFPALAQAPDLDAFLANEDNVERLEKGKLLALDDADFDGLFGGFALEKGKIDLVLFLIDEPAETAWDVLNDFEANDEFMPRMEKSEVKERDGSGYTYVCYTYDVLWIESRNCFHTRSHADTKTLTGVLDQTERDDRLKGVNYFWHVRPWRDGRTLVAYYQKIEYSGGIAAFGHRAFVGPKTTAEAVRKRIREVAKEER